MASVREHVWTAPGGDELKIDLTNPCAPRLLCRAGVLEEDDWKDQSPSAWGRSLFVELVGWIEERLDQEEAAEARSERDAEEQSAVQEIRQEWHDLFERAADLGATLPCGHGLRSLFLIPPAGSGCRECMDLTSRLLGGTQARGEQTDES